MTADAMERLILRAFETGGPMARVHGILLLTLAARAGRLGFYLALVRGQADATDRRGRTALFFADTARSAQGLLEQGAWATFGDHLGRQPLHVAAGAGRIDVVRVLLASDAQVNDSDRRRWTALHHAAAGGKTDCVAHLLGSGADPDRTDRYGRNPFDLALICGHVQVMALLAGVTVRRASWTPELRGPSLPLPIRGRARAWRPPSLALR